MRRHPSRAEKMSSTLHCNTTNDDHNIWHFCFSDHVQQPFFASKLSSGHMRSFGVMLFNDDASSLRD
jgi:hypothetical protein